MKKVLATLLALIMVLTMASFPAFAEGNTVAIVGATGKTSNYGSTKTIDKAYDNDDSTYFNSDQRKSSIGDGSVSIVFELEKEITLDSLTIKWGGKTWGSVGPDAYNVYVSADNETYEQIFTYAGLYTKDTAAATYPSYTYVSGSESGKTISFDVTETNISKRNVKYIKVELKRWLERCAIREISVTEKIETGLVATSYTVKYQYADGSTAAADEVVDKNVFVGDEVTVNALDIEGYTPDATTKTIVLVEGTNEIVFTYTRSDTASYTVKYLDTAGNPVADAKTVTEGVYAGDEVTEEAVAVAGYKPTEASKTVTLVSGENTITFTYNKMIEATLTVKYLDEQGNAIADAKTVESYEGETITETAPSFYSNSYFTTDNKKTITLASDAENTITFTYKKVIKPAKATASRINATAWYNTQNVTDGKISTSGYLGDGVDEGPAAEIVYEFSKPYAFDKVTFYQTSSSTNVSIYVSNDGVEWGKPVFEGEITGVKTNTEISKQPYAFETELNGITGKYVKYVINAVKKHPDIIDVIFEGKEPSYVAPVGASIRIPEDGLSAGLRFASRIIKEKVGITGDYEYNESDDVKFGVFLLPEDLLGTATSLADYIVAGGDKALEVIAKRIYNQDDEYITYTAVLTDIPESAYGRNVVSVPFMLKDGEYTFFAEITRSYKAVAVAARETDYSDEAIAAITDPETKAKMQAIADGLDTIIDAVVETKKVVPAESDVYSMGRTSSYKDLLYAGAVYEYKCTGSVVGAELVKASGDDVRFEVSIDGGEFVSYTLSGSSAKEFIFARDLNASKEHTVRIMRATDIWGPKLTVNSVVVAENADVVKNYTRDYDLKIEFVGDSITSGVKTPLYAQSYAYLTAEAFNANFNAVSRSGLGLHKNANNGSGGQLKSVYAGIAMEDGRYQYDYNPDLVVLNIGTNDGANVGKLSTDEDKATYRAAFKEKYIEILTIIHEKNPNAIILCTGGLMGDFGKVKTQVTEAVAEFKAANPDVEIYCEYLTAATDISSETSWHPGVTGHAKGAQELIAIIEEILG